MPDLLDGLILLPRLRVEGANAISGPLSWGFPALTAFTGFAHALQRKLTGEAARLDGVGVVCHRCEPQVYRPRSGGRYHFCLARHPLQLKKGGKVTPAPFIEEGRVHLEISLLLGTRGSLDEERTGPLFAQKVLATALGLRLAGGSLWPAANHRAGAPRYLALGGDLASHREVFRRFRRRLLPGFTLLDRTKLPAEHLAVLRGENPAATPLDALLDLCRLKVAPTVPDPERPDQVVWQASRVRPGWLVPLPVGFGAISALYPPGQVKNARDGGTPFRFVETLYSLGEWVAPHRLDYPEALLWRPAASPDQGLYLCAQTESDANLTQS